jgi:hypothetical protein
MHQYDKREQRGIVALHATLRELSNNNPVSTTPTDGCIEATKVKESEINKAKGESVRIRRNAVSLAQGANSGFQFKVPG